MNKTMCSSIRQIQKSFKKTLYSPNTPLSSVRAEYDDFFYSSHIPNHVDISHTIIHTVPADILEPEVAAANRVILYAHGGSFVAGSCKASWNLCASLANECACKLFLPEYRLAPEYPFPAGLEDIYTVYAALLKEHSFSPSSIVFAGDDAGAALVTALVHYLKRKELPLPAAVVLISPWLDVSCSAEEITALRKKDKFLLKESLQAAAGRYTAADNFHNPLVSPLHGSFTKFPQTFIQCGEAEILSVDAQELARKIEAAGGSVQLDMWHDMWHLFQAMDAHAREAHLAIERIGHWVQSLFNTEK